MEKIEVSQEQKDYINRIIDSAMEQVETEIHDYLMDEFGIEDDDEEYEWNGEARPAYEVIDEIRCEVFNKYFNIE